ncbi:MAG: helix-turn-helix transcriptional regulator [Acutalibacter sp.]|nr:helix-turn-helix transcriptional regulator [Acutalibacter sp.]
MVEWNQTVQKMIDWLEAHLTSESLLGEMSRQVGYSPYYCSTLFHRVAGVTIKGYVAGRRLALAALDLRNSQKRVIDIAVEYGFSSQEALTRAFRGAFGCTPAAYRKNPTPIPLRMSKEVFHPAHYAELYQGGGTMSMENLKEARVRMEYIPAHKYMGIWEDRAGDYDEFWQYQDCDQVCGMIESMRNESHPVVTCHTAGWRWVRGERKYFYGMGVPEDYSGPVPKGFEIKSFPGSYYLVFYHPPFSYMEDNGEVMRRVEELAWNYDLAGKGLSDPLLNYQDSRGLFTWNEEACQCYQRHYPEGIGYEVLRPVKWN